MPESVQCRICLKGDVLGVRGVMLICGLCKRPTHHSCLTPPMPEAQLKMILRATLARDAPKIGHPRIWLCPRCMKRNPEAAKETVIERSKTGVGTAPPSSSRAPTTVSLSRQGSIVKAPTPKSDEVMIIDDDDLVEVVQPQAKAAAKSQSTPSTQVVLVSSDDDIQKQLR
ncbi:hypothetical protein BDW22DRAFT_657561 [Trametopsis cervina]|nr:hypothetical protein BDW22DRAFT_657561 [Trametopsis cervina]